ncbi:MAG: hypothetical protein WBW71_11645 [Bacteroidota bacterium]
MDRILFGDNQFFGVNHLSDEKAREQSIRFRETKAIIQVIDATYNLGLHTFMCTTHDRIAEVADHVRSQPKQYSNFQFYPCMPYAHKYANAVTDFGIVGALQQYLPGNIFSAAFKGSLSFATRDYVSMMELLIDSEMKMFRGLKTGAVFLQNVVTDLVLGLGMKDFLVDFADYVSKKYQATPGFITMNLPMTLKTLRESNIRNAVVCTSINKIGFRMPGGREVYEEALGTSEYPVIAMQVLAAGAIPPREALEYVSRLRGVTSILFGASTLSHIRETKELIEHNDRER